MSTQDQADHAASQISMWKSTGLLIRLEFSDVICTGTRMQPDDGPTHVILIALEAPESDLYRPAALAAIDAHLLLRSRQHRIRIHKTLQVRGNK